MFRDDPALSFDLLRAVFGLDLPPLERYRDRHGVLDRFAPCFGETGELRPDLAVSAEVYEGVEHEDLPGGAAAIIEVQKKVDPIKRWRLWVYWALLAEQLQLPTAVLLIPLSDAVSRWARALGRGELPRREVLLVLDRHNMPRVTKLAEGRRRPAMAVLSALIHFTDMQVVRVGLEVALGLPDSRRWRYASAILSTLPTRQRDILLGALKMQQRYELTERERNSGAFHDGKLEGKIEGLVELVLTVLELRHIPVDDATRARIEGCEDPELLELWVARAKRCDELTAVFAR